MRIWLPCLMLLALVDVAQAQAVLPGGNRKQPVNISAGKLDYFDKEQKLVYSGNVVATQGEARMKASTLTIFLTPKETNAPAGPPASASQVRRMEASGPVTIASKDQVGTGDSGIYEKAENKVYLIGNVTLTQGPNVTTGDKLAYDLNSSQAVVTGKNVHSMFLPNAGTDDAPSHRDEASRKTSRQPNGRSEAAAKTR